VLNRDDGYQRALYGLGLCQVRQGDHAAAVETLRRLLDKDRAYADYQAWLELAGALGELGERDKSIECLEGLVAACPRMDHTLALADALIEADRADDARARLERALLDYDHAPRHVQKQHARNAREARQILGKIA
jgi:tetratricopeptide (TPR) repeat protein